MNNSRVAWSLLKIAWIAIILSMLILYNPPYTATVGVDMGHLVADLGLVWLPAGGIAATILVINRE